MYTLIVQVCTRDRARGGAEGFNGGRVSEKNCVTFSLWIVLQECSLVPYLDMQMSLGPLGQNVLVMFCGVLYGAIWM